MTTCLSKAKASQVSVMNILSRIKIPHTLQEERGFVVTFSNHSVCFHFPSLPPPITLFPLFRFEPFLSCEVKASKTSPALQFHNSCTNKVLLLL